MDIALHGEKLHGGFTLIRTGVSSTDPGERKRWLLIKPKDKGRG